MQEPGRPDPSAGRPTSNLPPPVKLPEQGEEVSVEAIMAAYQATMTARLEEGLRAIHRSAAHLMRQLVAEVWKAAGPEAGKNLQAGILGGLARDDALRGVLTHIDERHQALSLEVRRMEEAVRKLAETTGRSVKRADLVAGVAERVTQASYEQGRRTQEGLRQLARWIERTFEPVSTRLSALEATSEAASARQRAELAAFTERTRQGLARVGQRLRHGFVALREQTSAENREALEALENAVHGEIERLERLSEEQATRSAEFADRVSESLLALADRTSRSLDALRKELLGARFDRDDAGQSLDPRQEPVDQSGLLSSIDGLSGIAEELTETEKGS
jgi:hypothetical protein